VLALCQVLTLVCEYFCHPRGAHQRNVLESSWSLSPLERPSTNVPRLAEVGSWTLSLGSGMDSGRVDALRSWPTCFPCMIQQDYLCDRISAWRTLHNALPIIALIISFTLPGSSSGRHVGKLKSLLPDSVLSWQIWTHQIGPAR